MLLVNMIINRTMAMIRAESKHLHVYRVTVQVYKLLEMMQCYQLVSQLPSPVPPTWMSAPLSGCTVARW